MGEISNQSQGGGRMPDISFNAASVLYGYGDFPSGFNEGLWQINTVTGAGTFIGSSGFIGGGNGLDFAPDGTLYATPFDLQCLVTINPVTGAGTCVAGSNGNVPSAVNALEFCPQTGVLYGSHNAFGSSNLITIDLATGAALTSVPTVLGLDAIAFRCGLAPPCPWDCQAVPNGSVSTADLLALLGQWGGPGSCDFDGSGAVGTVDLLKLLANWGPCP